nr:GNAT family N-acetyltransferase [Pelagibacterium xiamenense]
MGQDDLPLLLSAGPDVFDNPIDPELARAYLANRDYLIVLAVEDGAVVGMASGLFYIHPDKPREFFINEVGVAESHQRRGIGKAVLSALIDAAKAGGARYAWLGTETDNHPARALYRSLGGREEIMALYDFDLSDDR